MDIDALVTEEQERELNIEIGVLARSRQQESASKEIVTHWEAELEIYLAAFPNAEQLKKAKDTHAILVGNTEIFDTSVREKSLALYYVLGNKNIYEGVSIAEHTTFEVDDTLAVNWAAEHHHKGLKLNLTEIKKVAKAGMEVDGVVMGTENRVRIASDLSSYLADAE